jgi:hypothetical protein
MNSSEERGTARMMAGQIRINGVESMEIERAVVRSLTADGFDVEIEPEFKTGDRRMVHESSVIKVYRKVAV